MLGTEVENLGTNCIKLFENTDLRYEELSGEEEKDFILEILKR